MCSLVPTSLPASGSGCGAVGGGCGAIVALVWLAGPLRIVSACAGLRCDLAATRRRVERIPGRFGHDWCIVYQQVLPCARPTCVSGTAGPQYVVVARV